MHIPKTGGTLIEEIALENGVRWGMNMDLDGCGRVADTCPFWHWPPAWLPKPTIYDDKEVFCVVRNPFSRIVSEYRYLVANPDLAFDYAGLLEEHGCTEEGLNGFVRSALDRMMNGDTMLQLCHLIPQSTYIWGPVDEALDEPQRQWCQDILRNEDLDREFDDLMERKGYGLRLEGNRSNEGACTNLSMANLTSESRRLVRAVYFDDFDRLNYSMDVSDV